MRSEGRDRTTLLAFVLIVLFGGLNFVAVRFSNRELPPFWGAGIRFGAAALLLYAVVLIQRLPLPRGRALLGTLVYGLLAFGLTYALAYRAMVHVPAGMASVVMASAPLFTLLLAVAQRQEQFRWRSLAGAAVALVGIAIMFASALSTAVPPPALLAVAAVAVLFAEASIIVKWFPRSHPVSTNAVAMTVGTVILLVMSVLAGEARVVPVRPATWVALGHLILLGSSTAFVLFLYVLRRWSASAASYQFVLFPLVAILVGSWLEREPLTAALLGGGGLVLAGVYFGAIAQPAGRPEVHQGPEPCLTCVTPSEQQAPRTPRAA